MVRSSWFYVVASAMTLGCGSQTVTEQGDASVAGPVEAPDDLALQGRKDGGTAPQGKCPAGFASCRGKCYVLEADTNNCGACGVVCPEGWSCCGGACKSPDTLRSDHDDCGACGNACSGQQLCCDGACVAEGPNNCGTCGNSCGSDGKCCDHVCKCGTACSTATTCGERAFCLGDQCECPGSGRMCANGDCRFCGGYEVFDAAACTCTCTLTAASCGAGQVFDAARCTCVCSDPDTFDCGPYCCGRTTEACNSGSEFADAACRAL